MARLNIDTGIEGNTATGDTIRTAMSKINTNFEEVFSLVGDGDNGLLTTSVTNGNIKVQPNSTGVVEIDSLQITDSAITSITTNSDVTITANGTGNIVLGAITINGTTISSQDSTKISINEPKKIRSFQIYISIFIIPILYNWFFLKRKCSRWSREGLFKLHLAFN